MNIKRTILFWACMFILSAANAVSMRGKDGIPVPGTDRDNPAAWSAFPTAMTRAAAPGSYSTKSIPLGKCENLVVLVDFPDRQFSIHDQTALVNKFNDIFNKPNYFDVITYKNQKYTTSGSVKDYFISQSYGKFEPSFNIIGPITTDNDHSYYGRDKGGSDDSGVQALVREICNKISNLTDLEKYDLNEDGRIDQLSIIYAGRGQNYLGAESDAIWPQANCIDIKLGKIKSVYYLCTCELFWDSEDIIDGIGTFCHEYSHTLGLPDFYFTQNKDANVSNANLGYWSLMDYGNYENLGFSPAGYTAFERYSLGWLEITEITQEGTYVLPTLNGDKPVAYRLSVSGNDDHFLIMENHQQDGWYKYQKSKGLMVTSVSYDNNSWIGNYVNRETTRRRYCLLPADNNRTRDSSAGDLFPYQDKDSITWYSLPQLAVTYDSDILKPAYSIYDIRDNEGTVLFLVGKDRTADIAAHTTYSAIQVFDLSGKLRMTVTDESDIPSGLWIIKQGNDTKKVKR